MLIELTKVLEQDDKVIRQEVPARGAGDTCV